jgi:sugar phosphate isomerase/epimerase
MANSSGEFYMGASRRIYKGCSSFVRSVVAWVQSSKIGEVQLADADIALRGKDLTEHLLRFRKLPGEGAFDIKGVTDILKKMGAYRSVGPEVFADAMDALDAVEAGRRAGNSLDRWINE